MRTEEIVATAQRNGWLSSDGKTPVATMRGQLGTYVGKGGKSFTTPSAASCFVHGGLSNGWHDWKNANGERLDVMRKETRQ